MVNINNNSSQIQSVHLKSSNDDFDNNTDFNDMGIDLAAEKKLLSASTTAIIKSSSGSGGGGGTSLDQIRACKDEKFLNIVTFYIYEKI